MTKLTQSVPAFTDAIDTLGTYGAVGICGEKFVALDSPPAFVSITLGANKLLDPFEINYDGNHALESEVGTVFAVKYKVTFKEYGEDNISPTQFTFDFEIKCPSTVQSSSLTKAIEANNFYDVADPEKVEIKVPVIAYAPGVCFTITGQEVLYKEDSTKAPTFVSLSTDKSKLEV